MSDEVAGGWWKAYQLAGGIGCDYTFNPLSQVSSNPHSIEAVLTNNGSAPQNMTLHAEVTDAIGNIVHTSTSNSVYLSTSQQDTFMINQPFSPTTIGLYTISMWGVGDSAYGYNSRAVVTDYTYGKDLNNYQGGMTLPQQQDKSHYHIWIFIHLMN